MKKISLIAAGALAAALILMPDGASAQVTDSARKDTTAARPTPPVQAPAQANRQAAAPISDSAIIAMLQLSHTQEIAASEVAAQRAQSDRVKKFAEELKVAHQNALQELQSYAEKMKSSEGMSSGMARDSARVGRDNNVITGRRDSAMARPDSAVKDSARVGRDPNANVGRPDSARQVPSITPPANVPPTPGQQPQTPGQKPDVTFDNLSALSGHEFDHGFIRLQVQHHETEINHLRNDVIPMIKDSGLKALVQRQLPTLGNHLRQARELEAYLKTTSGQ